MKQIALAALASLSLFACAAADSGDAADSASEAVYDTTTDLRAASWNVRDISTDGVASGDAKVWGVRRDAVIAKIVAERPDVLGLQEASCRTGSGLTGLVDGPSQCLDLLNGVNKAGGSYAIVDSDPTSSAGTRIIYDTNHLSLVRHGVYLFQAQVTGIAPRFFVWAVFTHLGSGDQFFFGTTHLAIQSADVQRAEWKEIITQTKALHGALPVVITGDFQASKFKVPADVMLPAMKSAGFGDVTNQKFGTAYVTNPRAQHTTNKWINSVNEFDRNVADHAFEDDHSKYGDNIDWIFATNSLPVKNWKVILDFNPTTLKILGTIPSDHDMVEALITLP